MTLLPSLVFACTVSTFTVQRIPTVAVDLSIYAKGARLVDFYAVVNDMAGTGNRFGVAAGIGRVFFMGLQGLHVEGKDILHSMRGD